MSGQAIAVRGVHLRRGSRQILSGVDLDVTRGEIVALMGASGSGKTTLLRVLAGLEPFDQGRVDVEGTVVAEGPQQRDAICRLREKMGMVFQFHCLFEHLPALQNVMLALVHVHRTPKASAEARARELLTSLGVEHRAHALPRELSGGEAQRVAIARALATDPTVLLMDEPTASLDPSRRMELAQLVRSLAERPRTLLVATHDEDFAAAAATRILYMQHGRITPLG